MANILKPDSNQTIEAGGSINFQCNVTEGNPPFTYSWDFDEGAENSTLQNPGDVFFTDVGTYHVTFTVTDADGDIDRQTLTITVHEQARDDNGGGACFISTIK